MLTQKIAYNTIVSLASRVVGTIIALVNIGLITRYLGQNGFGDYSTILAFLYVFSVLADLGLYSITLREISKAGAPEKEIVSHAFSLRLWAGLFIFGLAALAVWLFPYSFEVKVGTGLAALGFWLLSINNVLIAVFQKYLRMEKVALAELAGRAVQLGLSAYFVWKNFGFFNIVLATSISGLANFLLLFLFVRTYIPLTLTWNFSYWRQMLKKSYPLAISAVFVMIYFKLDTVMLSLMKSSGDVGIYGVAYKILESLIFFPAVFVGLLMPLLSKYAFASIAEFKKIAQRGLDFLIIFSVPLVAGGLVLSRRIINLIAGPEFAPAAGILNILIFATAIIFFGTLFSSMIIALEKQKALAKIYSIGAIVNFGVNLVLIPRFSYWGAAFSTLLTEFLVTAFMLFVIKKAASFFPSFRLAAKTIFSACLMAGVIFAASGLNLFLLLPIAFLVYFAALFALKGISIQEALVLVRRQD